MRVKFDDEFERLFCKASRKHCDRIHNLGSSWIGHWQFVYNKKTIFSAWELYDKMVEDKKIEPFSQAVIDEHLET